MRGASWRVNERSGEWMRRQAEGRPQSPRSRFQPPSVSRPSRWGPWEQLPLPRQSSQALPRERLLGLEGSSSAEPGTGLTAPLQPRRGLGRALEQAWRWGSQVQEDRRVRWAQRRVCVCVVWCVWCVCVWCGVVWCGVCVCVCVCVFHEREGPGLRSL